MAKFTDKQVLELMSVELSRRLESDEESYRSFEHPNYRLFYSARVALLRDLLSCLEFYSNYK